MDNTALIAPSMVDSWKAIEEKMTSEPMSWFSMKELLEVMPAGMVKSQQNLVWLLARAAVLKSEGRRGSKKYRLADSYRVGMFISGRTS